MKGDEWVTEGMLDEIVGLADQINRRDKLSIVVNESDMSECQYKLQDLERLPDVESVKLDHFNIWLRDTGPSFVHDETGMSAITWTWNGYGSIERGVSGYTVGQQEFYSAYCEKNWKTFLQLDLMVGQKLAADAMATKIFRSPIAFEGGSIVTDGEGTGIVIWGMMSRMAQDAIAMERLQKQMQEDTGLEKIIWLPQALEQDGSQHADMVCAFVGPGQLLVTADDDEDDRLASNVRELRASVDAKGREFKILTIPSPPASPMEKATKIFCDIMEKQHPLSRRSYVNMLYVKGAVLVPTFGNKECDERALEIIRGAVASAVESIGPREVVPVPWRELSRFGGGLRCATVPVPVSAPPAAP